MADNRLERACWPACATRGHCWCRCSAGHGVGVRRLHRAVRGTTGVMLGTAAAVGALTRTRDRHRRSCDGHPAAGADQPSRRPCALIVGTADAALPDVVQPKAEDALAAADAARPSVLQMAAAVDALDEAISAARNVSGQGEHAAESIKKTVGRLTSRRAKLLDRLTAAVDEVATVYAGLLELSATARTMGVSLDDREVGAVNDSVTLLQMTFAELEADAANLPNEGLV